MTRFERAKAIYNRYGINVEKAMERVCPKFCVNTAKQCKIEPK